MKFKYSYWYFQSAIPPRICDDIIRYGKEAKSREQMALTGDIGRTDGNPRDFKKQPLSKKEIKDLKKKRDSNIVWMSDRWIYKEIQPYIHEANRRAGWNFDWEYSESCQFTKYKLGQYYGWHTDAWEEPYTDKGPTKGKIRKLSVTVSLSDQKDYTGGELEFQLRNMDDPTPSQQCTEILPKGSLVVFPSWTWHRVKPVKTGTRYSLVIWNVGKPYR